MIAFGLKNTVPFLFWADILEYKTSVMIVPSERDTFFWPLNIQEYKQFGIRTLGIPEKQILNTDMD